MNRIIVFLFAALYALSSYSINVVCINVKDETSAPLSYCDVALLNKFYLITGEDGVVRLDASLCNVGDTLRIHYLGYESIDIAISSQFLKTQNHTFNLVPKTYNLDGIEVNAAFDAEKLFSKKKRNMLLPYSGNHTFSVFVKVSYMDVDRKPKNLSGEMKISCKSKKYSIIENTCTQDSVVGAAILRSLQLSAYIPYSFCFQKFRKHYDIRYIGLKEGRWNFMLSVNPRFVTHPFWEFQTGDNLSTQVTISEDGFVFSAETRAVVHSGASRSYNLYTEYTNYKSQMAMTYINAMLHEEKMHIELFCKYE